jgi:hypothetical protein
MRVAACAVAAAGLVCCKRTPDSKPVVTPKISGHRESTYGKALDSADRLKDKVADYNQSIEQTIEQGTNENPPAKKPAPPADPSETPGSMPKPPSAPPE